MDDFWNAIWSLTPTVLISALFAFVFWVIVRADRHERRAQARVEAEERAKLAAAATGTSAR